MSSYIGEIRPMIFGFVPQGCLPCDGSTRMVKDYPDLARLLGSRFGGDGVTTFGLPDLRGRVPVGAGFTAGQTVLFGQKFGTELVTLKAEQMAAHTHFVQASSSGTASVPGPALYLSDVGGPLGTGEPPVYGPSGSLTPLADGSVGPSLGNMAHQNMQPFLCINFVMSSAGLMPVQAEAGEPGSAAGEAETSASGGSP